MSTPVPLSTLDYVPVAAGQSIPEALRDAVDVARAAEAAGYLRVWYTEHHGQPSVGASAPPVLIGAVAARTTTIRVGSGGVMLPNHVPLVVAEQFGSLEAFHPGRIDLGIGRAPGGDPATLRLLRRGPAAAAQFRLDVRELRELRELLSASPASHGVRATPGFASAVPMHLLGSSVSSAQLAAELGLPYVYAAHFSPDALEEAVTVYRDRFKPSEQAAIPHLMISVNVLAALDLDTASDHQRAMLRTEARKVLDRAGARVAEHEIDAFLDSPAGIAAARAFRIAAVGSGEEVRRQISEIARSFGADELLLVHQGPDLKARLRSLRLTGPNSRATIA